MVTTVRSRPSHYEVLGLTPTATSDEIAQAFVRRMSLFRARPLADVAQVTSAYETLRNPEKRREYDRSLEPKPEPKLEPEKLGWSFALAQPAWRPFIASVPTGPMAQPAAEATRAPEPHVTAQPDQKISADPRLESIAASLRELAKPGLSDAAAAPAPSLVPEPMHPAGGVELKLDPGPKQRRSEHKSDAGVEQLIQHIRIAGRAEKEKLHDPKGPELEWKRPVFAAGGLILGVGLLGGIAGISAGGAAQDSVTVAVPAPKPAANVDLPAVAASSFEAQTEPTAHPQVAAARTARARSLPKPAFAENELVELSPAVASTPAEAADTPSEPAAAEAVPASLPLPSNVIARTIDRIGYPCGSVASATSIDGQGAFKITCSSGQSYQAAPVGGHYRFRRWGRH